MASQLVPRFPGFARLQFCRRANAGRALLIGAIAILHWAVRWANDLAGCTRHGTAMPARLVRHTPTTFACGAMSELRNVRRSWVLSLTCWTSEAFVCMAIGCALLRKASDMSRRASTKQFNVRMLPPVTWTLAHTWCVLVAVYLFRSAIGLLLGCIASCFDELQFLIASALGLYFASAAVLLAVVRPPLHSMQALFPCTGCGLRWRTVLGGLALSLSTSILVSFLNTALGFDSAPGLRHAELAMAARLTSNGQITSAALLGTLVGLIGPLWEELFFRGFLLTSLMRGSAAARWKVAVVESLVFGAFHCPLPLDGDLSVMAPLLPTAAIGFVFSILFINFQDIVIPILVHQIWNGGYVSIVIVMTALGASPQTVHNAAWWYV